MSGEEGEGEEGVERVHREGLVLEGKGVAVFVQCLRSGNECGSFCVFLWRCMELREFLYHLLSSIRPQSDLEAFHGRIKVPRTDAIAFSSLATASCKQT